MAKVKQLSTCKSCGSELLINDQAVCHVCGYRLRTPVDTGFEAPDYLFYQRGDRVLQLNSKKNDYEKKVKEVDISMIEYIKKSEEEDRIASVYDAFFHVKYLIVSDTSMDTLKKVVTIGKRIGKLAQVIEDYVKNQGATNASRDIIQTEAGDDDENP